MIIIFLGKGIKTPENKRASYKFDKKLAKKFKLKKNNYTNMLPLLIDNFKDKQIIPIYTQEAKESQLEVLKDEFNNSDQTIFDETYFIKDTKDFSAIMKLLTKVTSQDDSFIIDLTHSFRHLPILATIALISNYNLDNKKVQHIFFAKEETPSTKDTIGKYEIIDLKNYLELANISFILSSFNQNYTIATQAEFTNPLYQKLTKELKKFSEHFLANSLKSIVDGDIIDKILQTFDELKKEEDILNLNNYIVKIKLHLKKIKLLRGKNEYEKLLALSQIMYKRGYQLNAITLLFEALGYYCKDSIYQYSNEQVKKYIDKFEVSIKEGKQPKSKYSSYTLTKESRNIIKLKNKFKGDFLFDRTDNIKNNIQDYIENIPSEKLRKFQNYINDMEILRNNLAHGNSSEEIKNIERLFDHKIEKFKHFIIEDDILKPELFNNIKF
jgi:CRISPR-associated DxTHG motif protein